METVAQTRDVIVWFFQKLRERGRDRTYLKPLDMMVKEIDDCLEDKTFTEYNELNTKAIALIEFTMNREQSEFDMKPEYNESDIRYTAEKYTDSQIQSTLTD